MEVANQLPLKGLAILLLLCMILIPKAHGEIEAYTFSMNKKYNLETPAKFVLIYEYSNSVNGSVTPTGASIYTLTTTPVKTIFLTEQTDEFNIVLNIKYTAPLTQTITYAVYSGEKVLGGDDIPLFVRSITLNLLITTSKPTSQNESVNPVLEELGKIRSDMESYHTQYLDHLSAQWIVIGLCVIAVFGNLGYMLLRRRTSG